MKLPKESRRLAEDSLWISILKRAGLYKHPNKLGAREKRMQMLILSALSSNYSDLPVHSGLRRPAQWYNLLERQQVLEPLNIKVFEKKYAAWTREQIRREE